MKSPELIDVVRMLEEGGYIWSDSYNGCVHARERELFADVRANEPDVITLEELADNGLADPDIVPKECIEWLTERIRRGTEALLGERKPKSEI
jgi:hypothetical protein